MTDDRPVTDPPDDVPETRRLHRLSRQEAAQLLYAVFLRNADSGNDAANSYLIAELCRRSRENQRVGEQSPVRDEDQLS